jgi:hypothetical protein
MKIVKKIVAQSFSGVKIVKYLSATPILRAEYVSSG